MKEWKKIEEYQSYSINKYGEIRNDENGKIRKNTPTNTGYYVISFRVEKKSKVELVHRLLAKAFIENDNPKRDCINHIDGVKTNNSISNLEWVTKGENNTHAYDTGLMNTEKPVKAVNVSDGSVDTYPSAREASRQTGVCHKQISDNCIGRQKTAHGRIWSFI